MVILRGAEAVIRRGSRKGFTSLDALIALCLIGILTGIVIPKYQRVAHEAQKVALKTGLSNIRTSITLFRMLNGRNPDSLHELIEKDVMLPARIGTGPYADSIFKQKYLLPQAIDTKGNMLDSFGNPFLYDSVQAEVRSSTKGYETW
jgi:type II secretory pathway pseudopilin PulG